MHQDKLKRAIARQARVRRARDSAAMLLAAFAAAAVFFAAMAVERVRDPLSSWPPVVLFAVLALLAAVVAVRFFGAARDLNARLQDTQHMVGAHDHAAEHLPSVWSYLLPRRRG